MESLPWTLLVYLLLTCQVTVLGNRLSGQVGVQQCDRILTRAFSEKMYRLLQSYRTIPSIGSQPEYLEFTTKRGEKFCVNPQKARLMKEYVDSQSRVWKSASLPTAERRLDNKNHTTTEVHPRSLQSTADWGSIRPTETTLGSTETLTWSLLDRQPVTATPDLTRSVNLPTPVVGMSEGIPHTSSTMLLISPFFTSGCSHSEVGCLKKRALLPEIILISIIFVIIFLSLLSFAIYKCFKKSKSKGFNYHSTQMSSDQMGLPRLSHLV